MSAKIRYVTEVIPQGQGLALDLGGGRGELRTPLESKGYQYLNLENRLVKDKDISVAGDAHELPFGDNSLDLMVSKDTLEHFFMPSRVISEVHRVLRPEGLFIIWVPFMHPFHGDDFYRYTPFGLRAMLKDFDIITFDSPLWVFTVIGSALVQVFKRIHLGFLEKPIKDICQSIDRLFTSKMKTPSAFAAAYRIVAVKERKGFSQELN